MDKLPPHSKEAEQAVLGSILLDPDCIHDMDLKPKSFYIRAHQSIFQAMLTATWEKKPIDHVTLVSILHDQKKLDEAGGVLYLNELAAAVPTAANVEHYANIVKENFMKRQLIQTAEKISVSGHSGENVHSILAQAEELLLGVTNQAFNNEDEDDSIDAILACCNEQLEERIYNPDKIQGLSSGFSCLDQKLLGFRPGQLVVLAARPGMGKSAYAMNIAANISVRGGGSVAVFNLEMTKEQIGNRLICSEGNLDSQAYYSGKFTAEDFPKYTGAMALLSGKKLSIISKPHITASEIKAKCRKLQRERGLDLVIVDYLQLIAGDGNLFNRTEEVSRICRNLKIMALELNVPVIAISQLSRSVEQRQDKHPMLSDLRDSGAIEQDADVVLFMYRDDYYHEESEKPDMAELIIAKNREGATGKIEYLFLKRYFKFLSLQHKTAAS